MQERKDLMYMYRGGAGRRHQEVEETKDLSIPVGQMGGGRPERKQRRAILLLPSFQHFEISCLGVERDGGTVAVHTCSAHALGDAWPVVLFLGTGGGVCGRLVATSRHAVQ